MVLPVPGGPRRISTLRDTSRWNINVCWWVDPLCLEYLIGDTIMTPGVALEHYPDPSAAVLTLATALKILLNTHGVQDHLVRSAAEHAWHMSNFLRGALVVNSKV